MTMAKIGSKGEQGRFYSVLVSGKTLTALLAIFTIFLLVGWLFHRKYGPHGLAQYIGETREFVLPGDTSALFQLAYTALFAMVIVFFLLHLIFCLAHRFGTIRRRPLFRLFSREDLMQRDYSFSLSSPARVGDLDIEGALRAVGFRKPAYYSEDAHAKRVVCEKGFPFRWVSWLYHVCILLAVVGFIFNSSSSDSGYLAISVGERKTMVFDHPLQNWRKLLGLSAREDGGRSKTFEVVLEEFMTESTQGLVLRYPESLASRFLATWGFDEQPLHYHVSEETLYPRNWLSALRVYEDGEPAKKEEVRISAPMRYKNLSFCQIGCEYRFDVNVGGETLKGILVGEPFSMPQMEGSFRIRNPRVGAVFRNDEKVHVSIPSFELQHRPLTNRTEHEWVTVGRLTLGKPVNIMHADMIFEDMKEVSILGYRHGPGIPVHWIACAAALLLMSFRIYLPWYQVRCHADDATGQSLVAVSVRMVGLFARPTSLQHKITETLLG